jgi:asparagine synthase (glutamine-hydrolysing)
MLLHWEDRNSMAHSVEARVPFLDYRLVELSLGLPDQLKIDAGMTKIVLRQAMRGLLPEVVRMRADKLGFQNPEDEWLRNAPERFRAALREAVDSSAGIIRPDAMRILDGMIGGTVPFSPLPWRLISFGAWMRRFGVRAA